MRFENGQFERGISTSIRSMEELKKGMDFDDAVKGFNKLDEAAKGIKLAGLSAGVEAVRVKFDLLQITAFNVLNRISNKAIDTGERLVKSLSIEQVSAGWDKFGEKTGAVQTIMAATSKQFTDTGEQMEYVNAQLDKLNWFTDETSYNFVDMVNNIGKFTSNNIALDESVTAMQGIANWAAISGANAGEASRAMYNMSQAMSAGAMKLQDWISIENANMGTAAFKEMAIQMAISAGTLKKSGDKIVTVLKGTEVSVEKFRDTLSEGWLNKEVLMNTLNEYGQATNKLNKWINELSKSTEDHADLLTSDLVGAIDDYQGGIKSAEDISEEWGISLEKTTEILEDFNSETDRFGLKAFKAAQEAKTFEDAINSVKDAVSTGWMKSFEYIFGDYLEAKEFFTDLANVLYDIFAAGSVARNQMLHDWKEADGRDMFIDTIWNTLAAILAILKPIKVAWNNVFGKMNAKRLLSITESLQKFMENLTNLALNNMPKIERTFNGLFSILDILRMLIGGGLKIAISVAKELFGDLNLDILEFTGSIGDSIFAFRNWLREGDRFNNFINAIIERIKQTIAQIRIFVNSIKESKTVKSLLSNLSLIFNENFHGMDSVVQFTTELLKSLWALIKNIPNMTSLDSVKESFREFGASVTVSLNNAGISLDGFRTLGEKALNGLNKLFSIVANSISTFGDTSIPILSAITAQLNRVDWAGVTLLGIGIVLLALAWKIADSISTISKAFGAFADIGESIKGMTDSIKDYFKALKNDVKANTILKVAIAIGILAASFYALAKLDWKALLVAAAAMGIMTGALAALMAVMNSRRGGGQGAYKFSTVILSFAASIFLIAKALNDIKLEGIVPRLTILGTIVVALIGVTTYLSKGTAATRALPGIMSYIGIALAINILISALKRISKLGAEDLFMAIPVLTILMTVMALFQKITSKTVIINEGQKAKTVNSFMSMIGIAVALNLLVGTIKKLGKMDPELLVKGLVGLGAVMAEFSVLMLASSIAGQNANKAGKMILYISIALNLLVPAMKALGKLDEGDAIKALAIVGILNLFMSSLIKSSKFAGENAAKAGLLILAMAGAMMALQLVVKTLGRLDLAALLKGTIAVSVVILSIGQMLKGASGSFSEETTKSLVKLTIIIGILSGVMLLLSLMKPERVLASAASLSAVLLSLGASFRLMHKVKLPSMKDMGKLYGSIAILGAAIGLVAYFADPKSALAAATAMSEVLLSIGVMGRILKGTEFPTIKQAAAVSILIGAIGLVVGGLAVVYSKLGGVSIAELLILTTGVSEIILSLGVAGRIMGSLHSPSSSAMKGMIGWVISVGILVGALAAVMSAINGNPQMGGIDGILVLTTAISEIIVALGVASKLMGQNGGSFNFDVGSLVGLLAFAGVMTAVIAAFSGMSDPERVIPLATALSMVMLALGGVMKIMSTMQENVSAVNVGMLAILSVVVGVLGMILVGLSAMPNPEKVIPIAAGLSLLAIALSGVVGILGAIPQPSLIGGLTSVGLMVAVVAAMTAVVAGLGALMQLNGFAQILSDGGTAITLLGKAIGGFFGGIVGGFAAGLLSGLPDIGKYLTSFMEEAKGFFDAAATIPDNLSEKVGGLALAIAALGAAEFINGIASFASSIFGEKDSDLPTKFENFGKALVAFSDALGENFDADKVSKAADAGKALAELESSLPRKGGKLQEWLGEKDLGAFSGRLSLFGLAIAAFGAIVKDLDVDAVTGAASAGMALANLENALPRQGGKLQEWLGEKDLADFGRRIVSFGRAIKMFSMVVTGLDSDAVETAASAGGVLAELEKNVPAQNGMLQQFLGSSNIGDFGSRLLQFGLGLKWFATTVDGLNVSAISAATGAAAALVAMEKQVDTSGGWGELFTGKSDFSSFGENLKGLGEGLKAYDTSISAISLTKISDTTAQIISLIEIAKNPASVFERFKTIGESISNFAPSIGVWSSVVTTADTVSMANVTTEIQKLLKLSELTNASKWIADITAHAAIMVDKLVETIRGKEIRLRTAGQDICYWLIKGFEKGSQIYEYIATNAAAKLANKIQERVEKELGIASPSTVMIEEGHWIVKGLAEGITSDTSAEDAAKKKADNIVAAFREVTDKLDLLAQNRQLKYELWTVSEGLNASDEEYQKYEMDLKVKELEDAATKAQAQNAAFETAKKLFAEGSTQYIEAENNMLTAMKEMYNLRNEIDQLQIELMGGGSDNFRSKNDAYLDYINSNKAAYERLGWSPGKLIEDARKKTGFGMPETEKTAKIDTNAIIEKALGLQQVEIVEEQVKQKVGGAVSRGVASGTSQGITEGVEKGVGEASPGVGETIKKAVDDGLSKVKYGGFDNFYKAYDYAGVTSAENYGAGFTSVIPKLTEEFGSAGSSLGTTVTNALDSALGNASPSKYAYASGIYFGQGLINGLDSITPASNKTGVNLGVETINGLTAGINARAPIAISAAKAVADAVAAEMARALGINSPSKLTRSFGNYLDDGLVLGMREKLGNVTDTTHEVGNAMSSALDDAKWMINDIIESDDDFTPVITPVLNLSDIEKQGRGIGRTLGRQGIDLSAARVKVGGIADQTAYGQNGTGKNASQTTYNFTQNNYSPKALNRSEIYRHTNNQFSRLKGASQR